MPKLLGQHFTIILRTFNEADVLPYVLSNLVDCQNVICIDSGSTDNTLPILASFNIPVHSVPLPMDGARTSPDWYRKVFSLSPTKYILLVYCSHFYSKELIAEIDKIISQSEELDFISIPYCHYMYRFPAPSFSTIPKVTTLLPSILWSQRVPTTTCSFFFNRDSLDFSSFKIHFEFPVSNPDGLRYVRTKNVLTVVRTERFSTANLKTSHYSIIEADDLSDFKHNRIVTACSIYLAYPLSFLSSFIVNGGFRYGISGFISAHLHASYKLAVLIARWELARGFTHKRDFLPHFLDRIYY